MTTTAKTKAAPADAPRVTYATLKWAGGAHRFRLRTDDPFYASMAPPLGPLMERLTTGRWSHADIIEVVRLGLVGGGFGLARMHEADVLIQDHIRARPIAEGLPLAQAIVAAAVVGVPADLADVAHDPADLTGAD